MLHIHEKFNLFFDKLKIDGATSHLILLLYFILDYQLDKIIVEIEKTSSSMVKKYCQNIHNIIREKLWPYCGSSPAITAAFLIRITVANRPGMPGTVPELTSGVPCPGPGHVCPGIY